MGFPWLAIIYKQSGNAEKHEFYLEKTRAAANHNNELPELYYANTTQHNDNTPLAWAMGLWVMAEA